MFLFFLYHPSKCLLHTLKKSIFLISFYHSYPRPHHLSHLTSYHLSLPHLSTHTSLLSHTQHQHTYSTLIAFVFLVFSIEKVLLTWTASPSHGLHSNITFSERFFSTSLSKIVLFHLRLSHFVTLFGFLHSTRSGYKLAGSIEK